jgi:hypothetical protein
MSEFPKTEALIQWYWDENARLEASPQRYVWESDGFCQCSSEKIVRHSRDSDQMRAFLMIGVLIDEIMYSHLGQIYGAFREQFRYPKLHNHGDGGMAHPRWFRYTAEKDERTINWRTVTVVKTALLCELKDWFTSIDEGDEVNKFEHCWANDDFFLEPDVDLLHVNDNKKAPSDYRTVSPLASESYPFDEDGVGLRMFLLIDPFAEQLDMSKTHRNRKIVGYRDRLKMPFLLFDESREGFLRCGFSYALKYFGKESFDQSLN